MEELKKKSTTIENDKEIVFSKAIKAGKRIYYLDVKKNRKEEMFIAITESKKWYLLTKMILRLILKSTRFSCTRKILRSL